MAASDKQVYLEGKWQIQDFCLQSDGYVGCAFTYMRGKKGRGMRQCGLEQSCFEANI